MLSADGSRPWTFYAFAAFFGLFVVFLYGPMIVIYILSFQGPSGGMTFPLNGVSLHWFIALFVADPGRRHRRLLPALDHAGRRSWRSSRC